MSTERELIIQQIEERIRQENSNYSSITPITIDNDVIDLAMEIGVDNVHFGSQQGYQYYEFEINVVGGLDDSGAGIAGTGKLISRLRTH